MHDRREAAHQRWRAAVGACAGLLALLAAGAGAIPLAPLAAAAAAKVSFVAAPGLSAGPLITDAGLAWERAAGVMLTNVAGSSRMLARHGAANGDGFADLAWFGSDWWALARRTGVLGGRIGGGLEQLPLLAGCSPGSTDALAGNATLAVSGERLYAALPPRCLHLRRAPLGTLVEIDLRTRRVRVLAPLPSGFQDLAAAGHYLAIGYPPSAPRGPLGQSPNWLVRVLDAATGAVVNQVALPRAARDAPGELIRGVQIDDRGEVLMTNYCCVGQEPLAHLAVPFRPAPRWWWAAAGARVARGGRPGANAVLSDGRVAYFQGELRFGVPAMIDVADMRTGATRTIVGFSGPLGASGLALRGEELAWSQQSTVIQVTRTANSYSCTLVALGPVELARLDLRAAAKPLSLSGLSVPPRYAHEPACFMP